MCGLCSDNPKERELAIESEICFADQLQSFSMMVRNMARGIEKPHDPKKSDARRARARAILRRLADEWI